MPVLSERVGPHLVEVFRIAPEDERGVTVYSARVTMAGFDISHQVAVKADADKALLKAAEVIGYEPDV